jgi:hypothetical protein
MTRKSWVGSVLCALALATACSKNSPDPTSPTAAKPAAAKAAAEGTTLKASAPVGQSPADGARLGSGQTLTLVVGNSTATFVPTTPLTYEFEIFNAAGTLIYRSPGEIFAGNGTTAHTPNVQLEGEQTYTWWARAWYLGAYGPWSARLTFVAPPTSGYIRGNEMYDPLINGKTVGNTVGAVTFIPGLGAKLENQLSHIAYELPTPLNEGAFSMIVTNLHKNTEGGKTKLFSMASGYSDIVTNEYRMTVEKRGDPPGTVAWRFIARDDQIDTEGAEREVVDFDGGKTYFWEASWRGNYFNVLIREGGVSGPVIYDKGKHWEGRGYEPSPHVLYLGAPVGRSGGDGASVDGVIVRQVWVSNAPRPPHANQ